MARKLAKKQPEILRYEELEPRVLFSADAVPGLDMDVAEEEAIIEDVTGDVETEREVATEAALQTPVETRWELVFVGDNVTEGEKLIADLQGSDDNRIIEVVTLESDRDGIEQVSRVLSERSDLAAVHFITHGSDGQINLGNTWLNSATLQQNSDAVAGWGRALTETGDMLFYGCNIAADNDGQSLLGNIAELTGADVAASEDATGHESLDGDWELEYQAGTVETIVSIGEETRGDWHALLATATDDFSSGDYTGGSGWATDWVETNDTKNRINIVEKDGPGDWRLLVQGDSNAQNYWVSRQIDLSTATTATLSYDYELVSHWDAAFSVAIRDGDTNWTTVKSYSPSGSRSGSESINIDPTLFDSGLTEIRFFNGKYTDPDSWYIDNIQVTHDGVAAGDTTLYLDGIGDGSDIPVAALKTDTPTDTSLDNFDPGRDAFTGLMIAKGASGAGEADPTKYQLWVDTTAGVSLDGQVTLDLWSAVKNFDTTKGASITAYLVASNGDGSSTTEIASATVSRADWDMTDGGTWIQDTFDFGNITHQFTNNEYVGVKIVVDGVSADDMWLAYDATAYPSALHYTTGANFSPSITSDGGGVTAAINVAENTTAVTTVAATDADAGDTPTYSIDPASADAARFSIDSSTGELAFIAAPDFENPTDTDTDNVYEVTVQADDGKGGTDTQAISATVTNQAVTSVTATGSGTATAGSIYTLNLSADEDATSWTINWGDGSIETIAGNPTSVIHTYAAENVGMTFNIFVCATDSAGHHFTNELIVPTAFLTGEGLYRYSAPTGSFAQMFGGLEITDPYQVIAGPDGLLYVTGHTSDNVVRYNATTGAYVDTFVTAGSGGLNAATGLAFGPDGHLYVSSQIGDSVLKFDGTTGAYIETFVTAGSGGLNGPVAITFRPDGYLYVGSYITDSILRYDSATGAFVDTFVTTGSGGLNGPGTMAWGPDGNLYLGGTNSVIKRFDGTTGAYIDDFVTAGSGGLGEAIGLSFGPDGHLYVASYTSDQIIKYDGTTGALIGDYVAVGSGGQDGPTAFTFLPNQQVTIVSAPPVLALPGEAVNYTENDGAVVIDATATVTDADSNDFDGGTLTVDFASGGTVNDRLAIQNAGTGPQQISTSGNEVYHESTLIGTFTGGADGSTPLVITLNANADEPALRDLMRHTTYENISEDPNTSSRIVRFVLTDGDGGTSSAVTQTTNVTAINDDPTNVGSLPTDVTVSEDVTSFIDLSSVDLSDVDAGNNLITVTLRTSTGGRLWASSDFDVTVLGSGFSVMTLTGGVADLNNFFSSATRFQYLHGTSHTAGDNADMIQIEINDGGNTGSGGGGTIILGTVNVDITPVNDAPVLLSGSVNNLTVNEDAGLTSLGLGGVTYGPGGGSDESGQTLSYIVTVIPDPVNFGKIFLADGTTQVTTGSYTLTEIQGMQFAPNPNESGISFFSFNVRDDGGTGNGGADILGQSIQITVNAVNDAPLVANIDGDVLNYSEGDGAVLIEQGGDALVSDVDSINFAGGSLNVECDSGLQAAEDVFLIRNQGTAAGQIGVSGSDVTYGGTVIGTWAGGTGITPLTVTFNPNATPTAVTALVQNITYENTNLHNPTQGARSVTIDIADGDGGASLTQNLTINVAAVDDAAVITGDVSYNGNEGDLVSGDLNATDVEGLTDGTYFSVTTPASNGTAVIDPTTGGWTLTPTDANWFGSDSFTVTVTDDLGGTTSQVVNITLANVDDAAVITGDISYLGDEGDAVSGDLDATDVDGLTDGTYFTVSTPASNGTAVIDPTTGAWAFTPSDSDWFGTDSFTVTVADDLGGTTTQVVSITLANVDDAASITGDISFSGNEGDAVAGDLNATDVEGLTDGTYFSVTTPAANGTAVIDPTTGGWTFTPTDTNWFGTDSFTVTVTDDLGGTTTQVVSITLVNVDDAASITGDIGYSGNEGDAVSGDLNATDVEGLTDGTYFSVTAPAANGTAVINPSTGAWTFTPTDANWFGSDSFTVTVTDDMGGTTTQVVSITLANVDDASVITGDISYSGNEGDTVAGDLDATDVEGLADGTYFSVTTPATNGTAVINPTTGAWTFTPSDSDWFGTDSFTVTVTDDLGGTTTQAVSITLANVDDAASITGDISYSGDEGDAVSGDLDATDVDGLADGTYFSVSTPATNGTAVIDPTTGAWTFTPSDSDWFGSDSFTVTVTDDLGGTTTQVVNITLANVDDAASITGDISYSGDEGDAVTGDLNATDVDGLADGTYFSVSTPATNGTAVIDPTTGAWTFTPTDANWFGSDSFTVTVTDDLGGTTTQLVSITLANVDDAASITGDIGYSGDEGDAVTGDLDATDVEGLTDGTYFSVTTPASNGTAVIDPTTGAWTFTPTDANWFGSDSFTVTVTDDLGGTTTQVVNVTLANVDDAASITGDISFSGNEGDVVSGDLDATDVEGLTDGTYFSVTTPAANGTAVVNSSTGAWTFTPTGANWFGTDGFTVTVTDDLGGTTTQVVSVTLVNVDDASVITGDVSYSGNEGDAVSGDLDATDVEGLTDGTYFSVTTPASNGTAVIDPTTGAWTFTPSDSDWFGTDSFTVTVTDDLGGTTTQAVSITLANVDDAASITGDISYSGDEGDAVSGDLDATDVEGLVDGTYFSVTTPATNGTAVINPSTGAWTFTPTDANWFGSDSFTVTVTDDLGGTTSQVVNITLANVDDAAVITGDISYLGDEGDAVSGDLNAIDVDGLTDGTYFTVSTPATNGTAVINPTTGAWTFTPSDSDWFGTDSFTVTVTDDLGGTTTQVVNVTLAKVDDAASITGDISYSGNEGDAVTGDLDATDVDGLADGTYFSVSTPATNGTAVIDPTTGAWTFTPTDTNWFGSDSFTVTVTDDLGGTTTQVVSIALANVDDAASITGGISYSGNEGDAVTGDLDATDIDGLTDGTYFSVTTPASNGTAVIDPTTGAWTFTPADLNWFGSDSFTVTVTDDLGGTTTQVVNVTLANVDDSPVIGGDSSGLVTEEADPDIDGLLEVGGALTIADPDVGESSFQAETIAGMYGSLTIDAGGSWSYSADNTQAAIQQLDAGESVSDVLTVTTADGTTHNITITINGAEDAPVIGGATTGAVSEDVTPTAVGSLTITDTDASDNPIFFPDESPTLGDSGYGYFALAGGTWTYTLDSSHAAVQALDAGEILTDTHMFTASDGSTQIAAVTINGTEDAPVISGTMTGSVTEDGTLTVNGTLNITDVDMLDNPISFPDEAPTLGDNGYGSFVLTGGTWTYTLDNAHAEVRALDVGETLVDTHTFTASDGSTQIVTLTISGAEVVVAPPVDDSGPSPDSDFGNPEPEYGGDPDTEVSTDEETVDDPVLELEPPPIEDYPAPSDSGDTENSPVLVNDPEIEEIDGVIYLTDEKDADSQHERREDDRSYIYFENDLYKEMNTAGYANYSSKGIKNTLEQSNLKDFGAIDFTSADWKQLVAREDYDLLREEIDETFDSEQQSKAVRTKIVTATMTTFTVGIFSYFFRAGSLVASMMSTLPLWRGFDPVVIFSGNKKDKGKQGETTDSTEPQPETFFDREAE